ncbi:hypothetical protein I302_102462 [Kwoniella bestiolae CBS 10118]|uniref:Uncharacterized protein n=1 Tax=Kwoniella bestiolae CBS 10118 TaxID=1296100 RepID=A0A1B9GF32_9TREE|nr:hypothetical protein I302_01152 [Kwoniella bestiolae CBS 10118]OCF29643.1 hypothetical protein I302_01152 [Kwoniella bestiolae CBS 10118]
MDIDKSAVPPPPRRKRSVKRCLCISCILLAIGVGIFIAVTLISAARTTIEWTRNPHKALLYNGTITPDLISAQVVKPLIDSQTKFDILFTVYARIPNEEVEDEKQRKEYADEGDWKAEEYTGNELAIAAKTGKSPVEIRYLPAERVIYQDVVFEELTLDDKDVEKMIKFELPLKRFYDDQIYPQDVRGAIALLPHRPSKLDRLDNFTSWKPEEGQYPVRINEKYIQSSNLYPKDEDHTIQWQALEQLTYAFPLIEFHNHGDPCNSTETKVDYEEFEDDLYASIRDEEEHVEKKDETSETGSQISKGPANTKHEKKPKSWMHPHIVARSHVYMIKETRFFDRKAYDKAHKELRKIACGKASSGNHISRFFCSRTYPANGHWENRFVLNPEGSDARKKNKELAYGPYLDAIYHAAGPKDVHALPVTRHNCSTSPTLTPDPETLPINFTLRFSSLTPARVSLLNNFVRYHRVAHNASDFERASSHNDWEQASGVFGAKKEGTHPIRRLIITTLRTFLAFPILILNLIYWYTRSTTVGINHPATYISSGGLLLTALVGIAQGFKDVDGWSDGVLLVLLTVFEIVPAILQLKATLPIELVWDGWWKFSVRRWRWSHNERNSMRRGTGVDQRIWVGVFILLFLILYIPLKYSLALIHPSILPPPPIPSTTPSIIRDIHESQIFTSLSRTLEIFSLILQVAHNHHNLTFAGNYKITTYMILGYTISELVYLFPSIIGEYHMRMGLAYITVIEVGIEAVLVWQAWKLPKVDQKVEEEN